MLRLLLDEHISPAVAEGLRQTDKTIVVHTLADWEEANFMGMDDDSILQAARAQKLTLVTYDRKTIPPLLKMWAEINRERSGVIFIDEKTIPPSDFGGLVRALTNLFHESSRWNWTNRICFLRRN